MEKAIERLSEIAVLLGVENEKKIKDGITKIILDTIESDFSTLDLYIINPDEIIEYVDGIKLEVMKDIKEGIRRKLYEKFYAQIEKSMNLQIEQITKECCISEE